MGHEESVPEEILAPNVALLGFLDRSERLGNRGSPEFSEGHLQATCARVEVLLAAPESKTPRVGRAFKHLTERFLEARSRVELD